ncbi:lysozyme inhibitor LprI family protein [Silicimonas sp. MF1-12-2]|uniref:lysozyme inhibitor LprI family protein n=1 Tax=Silicimonas sp. MF1-12-2 TaxID=3384793 RepID=UPI0039B6D862
MRSLICLVFLASPVMAQELPFSPDATEACLAQAEDRGAREACIGRSAEACYSREGVYSNYAIGICFGAEADYWDVRLNTVYTELIKAETAMLKEMNDIGATVPDTVTALREMQRAWIPYRDAACWYEYTTWGGGSGGGPANAACLMHETGRQALELEMRLGERAQ